MEFSFSDFIELFKTLNPLVKCNKIEVIKRLMKEKEKCVEFRENSEFVQQRCGMLYPVLDLQTGVMYFTVIFAVLSVVVSRAATYCLEEFMFLKWWVIIGLAIPTVVAVLKTVDLHKEVIGLMAAVTDKCPAPDWKFVFKQSWLGIALAAIGYVLVSANVWISWTLVATSSSGIYGVQSSADSKLLTDSLNGLSEEQLTAYTESSDEIIEGVHSELFALQIVAGIVGIAFAILLYYLVFFVCMNVRRSGKILFRAKVEDVDSGIVTLVLRDGSRKPVDVSAYEFYLLFDVLRVYERDTDEFKENYGPRKLDKIEFSVGGCPKCVAYDASNSVWKVV